MRKPRLNSSSLFVLLISLVSAQTFAQVVVTDTLKVSWDQVTTWKNGQAMVNPLQDVHHYDIYIQADGTPWPTVPFNPTPIVPAASGTVYWTGYRKLPAGRYNVVVTAWGNRGDPTRPIESGPSQMVTFTVAEEMPPSVPQRVIVKFLIGRQ